MFAFSLQAEVGGYWTRYLNREKIFLCPDSRRRRRRRKKEGGGPAVTLWHPDSWTCRYDSNPFPQLILTHYSSAALCVSLCPPIPSQVGVTGENSPHPRTFTFQVRSNPPGLSYPSSASSTGMRVLVPVQQIWTSASQNKHKTDHQSHGTFMARK